MHPSVLDTLALLATAALVLSLAVSLSGRYALDIDDANLALSVERFDVRMHQPHPPGYLGYVLVLRALHALVALVGAAGPFDVVRWAARGFSLLAVWLCFLAVRRGGAEPGRARLAALLVATNPITLYYATDGQTHAAESAMSAALVWALIDEREVRPWIVGLLLAAGGALRPTYLLLAAPAVVWCYRRDWKQLVTIAAIAIAGTLAWLVPTVRLTGGWAQYRLANDVLVGELMSRFSLFSPTNDPRYTALNLRDTLAWAPLALAPLVLATRRASRRTIVLVAAMIVPSLAFYATVMDAEAGYLAGLVAPAAVLGAIAARRTWPIYVVVAVQLGFFLFAPQRIGRTYMLPNVAEILERDVRAGVLFDATHHELPPGTRVLVVSDFPNLTELRQLPMLRPETNVLFLHDEKWFSVNGRAALSYATAHAWVAAPGRLLRNDGCGPLCVDAIEPFDVVALDPRSSERLREALRVTSRCPVLSASDEEARAAQRWPRSCFGDELRVEDMVLRLRQ